MKSQDRMRGYGFTIVEFEGDTLQKIVLPRIAVYSKKRRMRVGEKKYNRLANAVKLTYPIAQAAAHKLREMETHLMGIDDKKGQKEYVKEVEKELKAEYMPIVKRMSMYQGMVLLKLIDRQTGHTSYALIEELRGKVSAIFWQGVTKMFGGNLKTQYDKEDEDQLIEQLIELYELGLL